MSAFPSTDSPATPSTGFAYGSLYDQNAHAAEAKGFDQSVKNISDNDPTTQAMLNLLAKLSGSLDGEKLREDHPVLASVLAQALSQHGLLSGSGTTMSQVFSGVSQAVGFSGGRMQVQESNGDIYNTGMAVSGPIAHMVAESVVQGMQTHFKDSSSGMMNLEKSSGLNMMEVTSVMNMLQQNGALQGMNFGTQENLTAYDAEGNIDETATHKNIEAFYQDKLDKAESEGNAAEVARIETRIDEAKKSGQAIVWHADAETQKDLMRKTETAAELMSLGKRTTGMEVGGDLMRVIESSTGMRLDVNGLDKVKERFEELTDFFKGIGIKGQGLQAAIAGAGIASQALTATLGDTGFARQLGVNNYLATLGEGGLMQQSQASRAYGQRTGTGSLARTQDAIVAERSSVSSVLAQDNAATALGFVATKMIDTVDPETRSKMMDLMEKIDKETDPNKRLALEAEAEKLLVDSTGQGIGETIRNHGGAQRMHRAIDGTEAADRRARSVTEGTQNHLREAAKNSIAKHQSGDYGLGSDDANFDFFEKGMLSLDGRGGSDQEEFFKVLESGDEKKIRKFMKDAGTFGTEQDIDKFIGDFNKSSDTLGGSKKVVSRMKEAHGLNEDILDQRIASKNQKDRSAGQSSEQTIRENTKHQHTEGGLESFARGILGKNMTDEEWDAAYANGNGVTIDKSENSQGIKFSDKELETKRQKEIAADKNSQTGKSSQADAAKGSNSGNQVATGRIVIENGEAIIQILQQTRWS